MENEPTIEQKDEEKPGRGRKKITDEHISKAAQNLAKAMTEEGKFPIQEAVNSAIGKNVKLENFWRNYKQKFLEELERHLPEKQVIKTHRRLMKARQIRVFNFSPDMDEKEIKRILRNVDMRVYHISQVGKTRKYKQVIAVAPLVQTQIKALELYYQITGRFTIKHEIENLRDIPDEQLDAVIEGDTADLLIRFKKYNKAQKLPPSPPPAVEKSS